MNHTMILKRIICHGAPPALLAATVVASSEKDKEKEEKEKNLIRPRDLPIYSKPAQPKSIKEEDPKAESALLSVVRQVREGVWAANDQVGQVFDKFNHIIETGKAHTSSSIQILREEENYAQRYGAIAVGGLLGYLVSIRRGWFKRIIYTTTGAAAVAAICYPDEAKDYSSETFRQTKHYIVIAYHFVNGVMRDYVGVQLPSLPSPLSESAPSSATLMPPPASGPSHISPPPMPPIDKPSSVSEPDKKQG